MAKVAQSATCSVQDKEAQKDKGREDQNDGAMDEGDVAEQMAADDFLQPQAQQPELEVPEDLNLDGDALDGEEAEDVPNADAQAEADDEVEPVLMDVGAAPVLHLVNALAW